MNAEIKQMWLDVLRSGEYKQGFNTLQSPDGNFCCLGVLCDLHRKTVGGNWERTHLGYSYHGEEAVVPPVVQEWAGLKDMNPEIPSFGAFVNVPIASLNDGTLHIGNNVTKQVDPHTFAQLADLIEEHL